MIPPETLTGPQAEAFRVAVREAFADGFKNALMAAAGLLFLAGVVGVLGLRKIGATPGD